MSTWDDFYFMGKFLGHPINDWIDLDTQMNILGVTPREVCIFLAGCTPVADGTDFDEWNW